MRISFDFEGSTGAAQVSRAVRTSNDGYTWNAPSAIGSYTSTAGMSYGGSFVTVDTTTQMSEFGIWAKNTSGSVREQAEITATIDLRKN